MLSRSRYQVGTGTDDNKSCDGDIFIQRAGADITLALHPGADFQSAAAGGERGDEEDELAGLVLLDGGDADRVARGRRDKEDAFVGLVGVEFQAAAVDRADGAGGRLRVGRAGGQVKVGEEDRGGLDGLRLFRTRVLAQVFDHAGGGVGVEVDRVGARVERGVGALEHPADAWVEADDVANVHAVALGQRGLKLLHEVDEDGADVRLGHGGPRRRHARGNGVQVQAVDGLDERVIVVGVVSQTIFHEMITYRHNECWVAHSS